MLSRVADSLFWTARYIERAEDTSRLLHVNFHGLLDANVPDRGRAWRELLLIAGSDALFLEHFPAYTAQSVAEFMLWHPENPDAVAACVSRARENARGAREQISSEMWEGLNRLHLLVSRARRSSVLAAPHDFFTRVRESSHSFQGVMKATLPRGEAYEFLDLGAHQERADVTARVLAIKAPNLIVAPRDQPTAALLASLLKTCGAFEAYGKLESDEPRADRVVEFLLLERRFPRAILFCLERCLEAIRSISGGVELPERAIGRLAAELAFADLTDLDIVSVGEMLTRVLQGLNDAAIEIADAYFTTRVILPGPYAASQQQQ
jgi:uncharacterized alpha-E superfamily protein